MRDLPAVGLSFAYYPSTNTVHSLVDLSGTPDAAHATAIRCSVLEEATRTEVGSASFAPDASGRTEIFWRTVPELDGRYVFRVEAVGIADAATEQPFVRMRPAWEGNTFGCSDTVPAPFTAVERRNGHVRTVLRDHEIGAFGLWNQVTAGSAAPGDSAARRTRAAHARLRGRSAQQLRGCSTRRQHVLRGRHGESRRL